eukprot:1287622-Pyramimonas_sp.AAC.1
MAHRREATALGSRPPRGGRGAAGRGAGRPPRASGALPPSPGTSVAPPATDARIEGGAAQLASWPRRAVGSVSPP